MGGWHRIRALVIVALVVILGGASLAAGQTDGGSNALSADQIQITVDVRANGSAVWTVEYHYRLDTANRSAAFSRLQNRLNADRTAYVGSVRSDVEQTVAAVENATGRPMSVGDVSVSARRQSVPREVGLVVHRFEWSGFAVVNDSTIRAGGPLRGFYIGPRTELAVHWPEGYEPQRIEPDPDETLDGGVVWSGGRFDATEPRIVAASTGRLPTSMMSVAGLLAVSVGVGSVTIFRRIRKQKWDQTDDEDDSPEQPPQTDDEDDSPEQPPKPLSNEEQVLWVLDRHDGRVKQQELATECNWGDSKTSKVVRELDDEGAIDVFRLGRENVITKPEVTDDR